MVLSGSFVRRDAHADSDIDLYVIGDGPAYELSRVSGFLVSTSWGTELTHRQSLRDPRLVGGAVPGWRQSMILHDDQGCVERLRQEAVLWTWDVIGDVQLAAWVAAELTGYAEEVHKLAIALERQRMMTAAVQRSILALRLATVMSVHCRLLYGSENQLWDMVSAAMGDEWGSAQSRALGLAGEPLVTTCMEALRLYVLATDTVLETLTARQRDVVDYARVLAHTTTQRGDL